MKYKIIVDKQSRLNPSTEKREYEIDIEELRVKGDVYDSLIITSEGDYVMRRLSLSEFHVLSVLDEPVKEPLKDINIELFEGDNYIYLVDMTGNKFYAEYLIKNEFNDLYVIHSEMNSAINQSAKEIEIGVNQKLTNYSTTEEMNAAIKVLADAIALEVAKKVSNEEIIAKLNVAIKDKLGIIEMIGNQVIIECDNFNLDKNGNMSCSNAIIKGVIESTDGKIGGWTINTEGLTNGTVFVKNDGASTIYTVADLIIMRGYIMGYTGFEMSEAMIKHYDFNGDGAVTPVDYVILQNLIGISMN